MFYHVKELQFNARVSHPDPRFATLLLEQFGGSNGELKAAMQYFTQAFGNRPPHPDKYDLLMDIAAEEFSHLEIALDSSCGDAILPRLEALFLGWSEPVSPGRGICMRASRLATALLLAFALAGHASAQTLTNLAANNNAPTLSPGVGLGSYLRSMSFLNIFSTGGYPQIAKSQVTSTSVGIPDPNTPEYFKAFGYQRLTPPLSTTDRLLMFLVSKR